MKFSYQNIINTFVEGQHIVRKREKLPTIQQNSIRVLFVILFNDRKYWRER